MSQADYTVYWQPGCTSCLKAKEYLTSHGIRYRSINVHEEPAAVAHLASIGVKSVPVVERGDRYVMAQNLDELASFLGVAERRPRLPLDELVSRLNRIMAVVLGQLTVVPEEQLSQPLRRDRTVRDLGYHVYAIVDGFLAAARGGVLSEAHFYRLPDPTADTAMLRDYGQVVARRFADWWQTSGPTAENENYKTYYGEQTASALLERTCWHTAQHCRQLDAVLTQAGVAPPLKLSPADVAGLPMPEHIWDDELPLPRPPQ